MSETLSMGVIAFAFMERKDSTEKEASLAASQCRIAANPAAALETRKKKRKPHRCTSPKDRARAGVGCYFSKIKRAGLTSLGDGGKYAITTNFEGEITKTLSV